MSKRSQTNNDPPVADSPGEDPLANFHMAALALHQAKKMALESVRKAQVAFAEYRRQCEPLVLPSQKAFYTIALTTGNIILFCGLWSTADKAINCQGPIMTLKIKENNYEWKLHVTRVTRECASAAFDMLDKDVDFHDALRCSGPQIWFRSKTDCTCNACQKDPNKAHLFFGRNEFETDIATVQE